MSGDITYTYQFTDATGQIDDITVTVDPTAGDPTGTGQSYDVTSITGTIDGVAITGAVGTGGGQQTSPDGKWYYDNEIFATRCGGIDGSVDGIDNAGLLFTGANGIEYNLYSQDGSLVLGTYDSSTGSLVASSPTTGVTTDAPCFCAGTMIGTDRGEVAVDALAIGDTVLTVAGEARPIRWIGRRAVAARFADPLSAMPVRIRRGALGANVPVRDVLLSPCHAVLVDGVLAHAGALVNGTSIVREAVMPDVFTYYHIELAGHELILADGMPSETFVDNADRMGFDNWAEHEALFGNDGAIIEMEYPRAKSARQVPAAIRARLAVLADRSVAIAA